MGSPLIWGGSHGFGNLLPANASGVLTTDATGNIGIGSYNVAAYAQAYFNGPGGWATTSSTFSAPAITGSMSFSVRLSSSLTVTAASGSICGITFTPPSTSAVYLIYAQTSYFLSGGGDYIGFKMWDGTQTIALTQGADISITASISAMSTIGGIYAPATTSPVTVSIQIANATNSTNVGIQGTDGAATNAVEWTIVQFTALGVSGGGSGVTMANVGARVALGV